MVATQCNEACRLAEVQMSFRMRDKGVLNGFKALSFTDCWSRQTQPSQGFTDNCPKMRKDPESGSCVDNIRVKGQNWQIGWRLEKGKSRSKNHIDVHETVVRELLFNERALDLNANSTAWGNRMVCCTFRCHNMIMLTTDYQHIWRNEFWVISIPNNF